MTPSEKTLEITIFLGMCKMLSAQSTNLIGEFQREKKQNFVLAMKNLDYLIASIEKDLSEYNLKTLELISDAMIEGIQDLREEMKAAK